MIFYFDYEILIIIVKKINISLTPYLEKYLNYSVLSKSIWTIGIYYS